jgi:hypothetical protein
MHMQLVSIRGNTQTLGVDVHVRCLVASVDGRLGALTLHIFTNDSQHSRVGDGEREAQGIRTLPLPRKARPAGVHQTPSDARGLMVSEQPSRA